MFFHIPGKLLLQSFPFFLCHSESSWSNIYVRLEGQDESTEGDVSGPTYFVTDWKYFRIDSIFLKPL